MTYPQSHWNYRVIRRKYGDEYNYQIHEVYYKNSKPEGWTIDPMDPHGETLKDLIADLNMMKRAFKLPVLEEKGKKLIEVKL